jgi:hypothetical protein
MSMISYGLILITSFGLMRPRPLHQNGVAIRIGSDAQPEQEAGGLSNGQYTRAVVGRFRWFIAGAAAGAGVLVAAPDAYRRLRTALEAVVPPPELPPGAPDTPATDVVAAPPRGRREEPIAETVEAEPVTTFESDDTTELRLRIDETRARIHEKNQSPEPPSAPADER